MDEDKVLEEISGSEEKLQAILSNAPPELNPYNEDGSINYNIVWTLLKSPKYEEWRGQEAVQPLLKELKVDTFTGVLNDAINLGVDLSKMGYAVSQIRRGKGAQKEQAPQFPEPPERSQALRQSLVEAARQANLGMSPEQSALAREEDLRNYRSNVAGAVSASGGQSGMLGQNLQGLARLRDLQAMRRRAQSAQERNVGANRMSSLAAQQAAENMAISQHGINKFRMRDMPMYLDRMDQARETELAGRQNIWAGVDSLGSKITGLLSNQQYKSGGFWPAANGQAGQQMAQVNDGMSGAIGAQAGQPPVAQGQPQPTANRQSQGYYGMSSMPAFVPQIDQNIDGVNGILDVDRYLVDIGMPSYPTRLKYR